MNMNAINAWASQLNLTPPAGHMINRGALLRQLAELANPSAEQPGPVDRVEISSEASGAMQCQRQLHDVFSDILGPAA
jgi:hypothetical protein